MPETRNFNPGPEEAAKSEQPVEKTVITEEPGVISQKVTTEETPVVKETVTTEKYMDTESLEDIPSKG